MHEVQLITGWLAQQPGTQGLERQTFSAGRRRYRQWT